MHLTTIGTGTVAPHATRVCAGHLVVAGPTRLLLDCGGGVLHRMAGLGIRWQEITHVALTHFHSDHWSDLAPLLAAWRYGDLPPRSAPVTVLGPPGTRARMGQLAATFGEWVLDPGYPLEIQEIASGEMVELPGELVLEARKVPHTDESVAYSVAGAERRLVYTGDTAYDEGLATWAAGCNVLLAECSLPTAMAVPSHLTPEQCGMLAAAAEPDSLVLTHFYPPVERVDIHALVAERFAGRVSLAADGWNTEI